MGHCTNMPSVPEGCREQPKPWDEFYERGWITFMQLLYIKECEAAGMSVNLTEYPSHVTPKSFREVPYTRTLITVSIELKCQDKLIIKTYKNKKTNGRSEKHSDPTNL
jgi:hypothetical protein